MARDNAAAQVAAQTDNCSLPDICRQALDALNQVLGEAPVKRLQGIDGTERLVVRLRDCLIDRYRRGDEAARARVHPALVQVNMAVSLIAGVEYPAAGVQEKPLQQALGVLQELLDRDLL
jgi:hypothetical protein